MKTLIAIMGMLVSLSLTAVPEVNRQVIYEAGTNGYFTYRIAFSSAIPTAVTIPGSLEKLPPRGPPAIDTGRA